MQVRALDDANRKQKQHWCVGSLERDEPTFARPVGLTTLCTAPLALL
jgi:hypothetical protein